MGFFIHRAREKKAMSAWYTYLVAATIVVGGAVGFIKAGSVMSLAAGGLAGLALAYAGTQIPSKFGYQLSIVIALVLGIMMGVRYLNSGKFMPAGLVSTLSISLCLYNMFLYASS